MICPSLVCNVCRSHISLDLVIPELSGLAIDITWSLERAECELVKARLPERAEVHICNRCLHGLRKLLPEAP